MRCALHLRQAWLVNNPRPPGLFIPQRLHRIGQGDSDCLITYCEQLCAIAKAKKAANTKVQRPTLIR